MKIAINAQKLLEKNPAGPELFTINLIKTLSKTDLQNQYILYFDSLDENKVKEMFLKLVETNPNFKYKIIKKMFSWTHVSLPIQLLKDKPDVYYTTVHTTPLLKAPNIKYISMIHGLEYKYSNKYQSLFKNIVQLCTLWYTLKFSDHLIVPSQATQEAIVKKFKVKPAKIKIIYEGVGEQYYKRSIVEIEQIKKTFNIDTNNYIIFVSTIQPRKNLPNTIGGLALSLKQSEIPKDTKLLIIGKDGWAMKESYDAPKKYHIEQNVKFLDRLEEEGVIKLLSGARLYMNLSFEEGFGLPLLEAMKCQVPCLVSDIPAFKELGKNNVEYVNPCNIQEISQKITDCINNYNLAKIQSAYQIAKTYTWEKTAEKTLSCFV